MRDLPENWKKVLGQEAGMQLSRIALFVDEERKSGAVYPKDDDLFRAFAATSFENVKIVILGQDPYHEPGQAHGLAFSVPDGVKIPPSLRNIFTELAADCGIDKPESGDLSSWAERGVLLLNTVLTVRQGLAGSHRKHGWEEFTDKVIDALSARGGVVFALWGAPAQSKASRIDARRNRVLSLPHPSPLSAHRGFLGGRPFSSINALLAELGKSPVDWSLPKRDSLF